MIKNTQMLHDHIATKFKSFSACRGGNVAMIFGLVVTALIGVAGAALDYTTASRARTKLQAGLDAGVLAAALSISDGQTNSVVQRYANLSAPNGTTPNVTVTVNGNQVSATASVDIATTLLEVIGITTIPIAVRSSAIFGSGKAEVVLVLDTTGSMSGAKLAGLQQAGKDFVTTLFSAPNAGQSLRMGLVPFNSYVNVGQQYRTSLWLAGANDYSTTQNQCYDIYPNAIYSNPRLQPNTCYDDGKPFDCSYTAYDVNAGTPVQVCGPVTSNFTWNGCVGSRNFPDDLSDNVAAGNPVPAILNRGCAAPLQRLTNDTNTLKAQIASLTASGETYIAPGLLWGWRVISPNIPFADGAPYDARTRKIIVLMTDGANTHSPNYPYHDAGDGAVANDLTAKTCTNIKASGIEIYTVAFSVTDTTVKNILADCATNSSFFFDSNTSSDLQATFQKIAGAITNVRLTN